MNTTHLIALKTCSGNFVCAEDGGHGVIISNRVNIDLWETFEVINLKENKIALKTCSGNFVCTKNCGYGVLTSLRNTIGSWETFEIINLKENKIALKACNGKFVCAENRGHGMLTSNRDNIDPCATFEIIELNSNPDELKEMVKTYAPIIYFSPNEEYFPVNVETFLNGSSIINEKGEIVANGTHLLSETEVLPDKLLEKNIYLKLTDSNIKYGDISNSKCYVSLNNRHNGLHLEINYFILYGYNDGMLNVKFNDASILKIGENEGVWQYITIVINTNTAAIEHIDLNQYGKTKQFKPEQLAYENNHVVIYSALKSHTFYNEIGGTSAKYTSEELGLLKTSKDKVQFELYNNNTSQGIRWDTSLSSTIITANIRSMEAKEPKWLKFNGRWGSAYDLNEKDSELLDKISTLPYGGKILNNLIWSFIPYNKKDLNGPNGIKYKINY
ncbi:Vps62-related protein [Clostridium felsineum]|uniref:Vps62-related protein n=1 Tax=Clostridium felsineum TaxID=36839 RepID=UPI00214D2297|nr:Vps62-related protein [Clostridium felsineum]MCR3761169.1 Vps62-related protein [Clostridium felsineum]